MSFELNKSRIIHFCRKNGGNKIIPIINPITLDFIDFANFQQDIDNCLSAQKIILNKFASERNSDEILKFFGLSSSIKNWISALERYSVSDLMMRVDFLIDRNHKPKICEFNIDSSIGGGEIAALSRISRPFAKNPSLSPFDALARMLENNIRKHNLTQVCILDWSTWESYGAFNFKNLINTLEYHLPGIQIFQCNEKSFSSINKQTLVYRVFQLQDCLDNLALYRQIVDKAGYMVSDFSGELLGNKVWMALIQCAEYQNILPKAVKDSIARVIPKTFELTNENFDCAHENRNLFFFKKKMDFGGNGVIPGSLLNIEKGGAHALLYPLHNWIVQEKIESEKFDVTGLDNKSISASMVFGIYKYGDQWSGLLLRASDASDVVNVAQGALIGWETL